MRMQQNILFQYNLVVLFWFLNLRLDFSQQSTNIFSFSCWGWEIEFTELCAACKCFSKALNCALFVECDEIQVLIFVHHQPERYSEEIIS